jgi:hypothetical protein
VAEGVLFAHLRNLRVFLNSFPIHPSVESKGTVLRPSLLWFTKY